MPYRANALYISVTRLSDVKSVVAYILIFKSKFVFAFFFPLEKLILK